MKSSFDIVGFRILKLQTKNYPASRGNTSGQMHRIASAHSLNQSSITSSLVRKQKREGHQSSYLNYSLGVMVSSGRLGWSFRFVSADAAGGAWTQMMVALASDQRRRRRTSRHSASTLVKETRREGRGVYRRTSSHVEARHRLRRIHGRRPLPFITVRNRTAERSRPRG